MKQGSEEVNESQITTYINFSYAHQYCNLNSKIFQSATSFSKIEKIFKNKILWGLSAPIL